MALLSFFFQAEDGIRDLTVTGVQTCALPISRQGRGDLALVVPAYSVSQREQPAFVAAAGVRSEERRVGKECRSGCWSYLSKENYNQSSSPLHDTGAAIPARSPPFRAPWSTGD